ncbi:hypothetical protein [Flavobacterium phycosphaerae]|uniref:hypothetical protein n=1 Tax=Flavobacterium phycosphaerae TaxID=2697515 RepID=UPI00138A399E|nr:hypothetical protein [Flavobacterium phycosphaerae]
MRYIFNIMILLLVTNVLSAQTGLVKTIKGKVISEAIDLDEIYVINLKSEATTSTEKGGYFTIAAAVGDTLMFSAIQIKGRKIAITDKDFDKELMMVKLDPMINRLDEVIVKQYKNINAVSLGIIPADTKHYTPAERKLKAAAGADLKGNVDGSLGASASLDPLFNWMSGRTAMLEKELEVEKKETLLQKIENQFGVDYFIEKLKIPKEYVRGFWYYVVEENRFVTALNAKNKTMATFVLTELATKYLEIQKPEKK